MKLFSKLVFVLWAGFGLLSSAGSAELPQAAFAKYCFQCHDAQAEGG